MRQPTIWVSDQVQHKPGCIATEAGLKLEISNLGRLEEELYFLCSENKGTGQLCSYYTADLRLCCRICRLFVFLCGGVQNAHSTTYYSRFEKTKTNQSGFRTDPTQTNLYNLEKRARYLGFKKKT